ncbi:MAG: Gfo/Idh/MocA family oxidoreductase [Capsulimonadales bacterium]|nr:Gfo/Idh/MocA family oxidoreductase [Capsulimonadales bacterium]
MKDGKIGVGIIGFGGIARGAHMGGYTKLPDMCEVIAAADILPERLADARSERWNIAHTFEDFNELLAMPEIDVVSVCTPNGVHKDATVAALRAGKHVLCEKPMAMNTAECREMIAAANETGNKLQIGFNMRFGQGAQCLKRAAIAGEFGEMYYARARAIRRRQVPTSPNFLDKKISGGGPLIDIGVHITDMTLWLMGHPKPVGAFGATYNKMGTKPGGMIGMWGTWAPENYLVEDFASALIRFENGATMALEASFIANIAREEFSTHLFGTEAGAYLDGYSHDITIFREEFGTLTDTKPGWLPGVGSTHGEEIRAFLTAVRDDRTIEEMGAATGEQAMMVTQIMDALYESAATGREATIA